MISAGPAMQSLDCSPLRQLILLTVALHSVAGACWRPAAVGSPAEPEVAVAPLRSDGRAAVTGLRLDAAAHGCGARRCLGLQFRGTGELRQRRAAGPDGCGGHRAGKWKQLCTPEGQAQLNCSGAGD